MDSQWLKIQFDLNPDKTKAGLAKAIGLQPPAVSKILKGTRQIKAHEYMRMREYFELSSDTLSRPQKSLNNHQAISHPNSHAQDGFEEMAGIVSSAEWVLPAGILSKKARGLPEQIKIFEIHESIMEPDFSSGEKVLVDLSDCKPSLRAPYIVSDGF
jgi:plasmid maintenance system antidote protein VapI